MFDAKTVERLRNAGRRPCPRCGRLMADYLEMCCDCMWTEAETALHQEQLDEAMIMAELEAREADRRDLRDTQDSVRASMRGR